MTTRKKEYDKRRGREYSARLIIAYPDSKKCTKCQQVKDASEFHKDKFRPSGLNSRCKDCRCTDKESLRKYKGGAIKRNFKWDLSDEEAIKMYASDCFYCGAAPKNGIDRIDSSLGYSASNCVPCCFDCNFLKKAMSLDEFKEYVMRLHSHTARIYSHWIEGQKDTH